MSYELFEALYEGNIEQVKGYLSQGEDIYKLTESEKWSYLHKILLEIVEKTPIESIQFLIDQGLDVNAIDSGGYTPLLYAVRQRNVEGVRLLLENGADKLIEHYTQDGINALRMSIKGKPYEYKVVKVLLDTGANPDTRFNKNAKSFREMVGLFDEMPNQIIELVSQY